jgi:hypothetical protein
MFPQINFLRYNYYRYGSPLVQDQVKFSASNSRSGSQLTMQCYSSKLEKTRIRKYHEEENTIYENYITSLLQYTNQIMSEFVPQSINLQSIINHIKIFMHPKVIINLWHCSHFRYGSSLVQDQLNFWDSNDQSGSQLAMQCYSSNFSRSKIIFSFKWLAEMISSEFDFFPSISFSTLWINC